MVRGSDLHNKLTTLVLEQNLLGTKDHCERSKVAIGYAEYRVEDHGVCIVVEDNR